MLPQPRCTLSGAGSALTNSPRESTDANLAPQPSRDTWQAYRDGAARRTALVDSRGECDEARGDVGIAGTPAQS
jgi:hypothetical protein